jgi:hypothetical protein
VLNEFPHGGLFGRLEEVGGLYQHGLVEIDDRGQALFQIDAVSDRGEFLNQLGSLSHPKSIEINEKLGLLHQLPARPVHKVAPFQTLVGPRPATASPE